MLMAILGLIPGLTSFITNISTKYFDTKVRLVQARIGGDVTVATKIVAAQVEQDHNNVNRLSIFASNKFLTFLLVAFALPLVGFEWKVIFYDKMLGWGSTDELGGQVASWAQSIIYFLFGAPTVMGLGKMWFGRDKSGQ